MVILSLQLRWELQDCKAKWKWKKYFENIADFNIWRIMVKISKEFFSSLRKVDKWHSHETCVFSETIQTEQTFTVESFCSNSS